MEDASAARFRQGAGRLCLDFIRTLRFRGTPGATEELVDAAALAAWASQCGPPLAEQWFSEPVGPRAEAVVLEARRLREAIRDMITATRGSGERSAYAAARRRVNRAAEQPPPVPRLDPKGQIRWHAADPPSALLSLLARDVLELVTSPAADRIRECAQPDCAALFLDNSRPGSRRWCSMDMCGNRAKKATLRHRMRSPTC